MTMPLRRTYLALNKPTGVIVSAGDPGRRTTVYDLVSATEAGSARLFRRISSRRVTSPRSSA